MSLADAVAPEIDLPAVESFDSLNPANGEIVGSWPIHGADDVQAAVDRAVAASTWWREQGFAGRRTRLKAWKGVIARRMHELADLMHTENGKPHADAILELTLAIDHIEWASVHAGKILGPHRVSSGLLAANQKAILEYQPFGVIGVIGPWNYPVFTPMGSIAYALSAGNAVVFKPSEFTPGVGAWLVHAWEMAVPDHKDVFQLITGLGDTGAALCRASGVGKIAFTGSARTGKKVMAACAENLVPVLMECGGKDAMIVDDDANVKAAAEAALWGGMSNAGQTCIGIERVYATEKVYDSFVSALTEAARGLRAGSDAEASYGPITMPSQVDIIKRHIADATSHGGRVLTGGSTTGDYVEPTVIVDVPESSSAVTEETFGPTITVARVRDVTEAIAATNATSYGLAGSVFTGSRKRGLELARQMRSGMTSVNSVISFASVPSLPFGGVGDSGFGRIHGADGLREFTRPKSITVQRFALPINLLSFSRPAKATDQVAKLMGLLHGRA